MKIGAADAAGFNSEEDFIWTGFGDGNVFDGEGLTCNGAGLVQHGSAHGRLDECERGSAASSAQILDALMCMTEKWQIIVNFECGPVAQVDRATVS